ncbi:MAG: alcohol dehydrogenase catalytic domain-containing protein [Polyangiaceae bacterium]
MKIRAAVARAGEPFSIEECELGEAGAREVLVRVEACGVCATDLHAKDHAMGTPLPAVLGHEGVGRIVAVGGGVEGLRAGDRVVMSFGACGECRSCQDRMPAYCHHAVEYNLLGRRRGGESPITLNGEPITGHYFGQSAFAGFAVAAAANLVKLEEDLPAALMAPLACGVQTGMGSVVNVLAAGPGDSVAVLGCGTVGLAAVMAAKIAGCERILAVDMRESRLALAEELGVTSCEARNDDADLGGALRGSGSLALDSTGVPG